MSPSNLPDIRRPPPVETISRPAEMITRPVEMKTSVHNTVSKFKHYDTHFHADIIPLGEDFTF